MSDSAAAAQARLKPVLFHRRDERESRAARELIVATGLRETIDFEEVSSGSRLFTDLAGAQTPALWDGKRLHEGLVAVLEGILPERPTAREEMKRSGPPPERYAYGEELRWDDPWVPMTYSVELPFWLMVADCNVEVEMNGHEFEVEIRSDLWELYAGDVRPSRRPVIYFGARSYEGVRPELARHLLKEGIHHAWRPCRSVVRITSRCNAHVVELLSDDAEGTPRAQRVAQDYLAAMCEVHLPVVNRIVQAYRLATYDYFPYEVSPWDVPVWYCERGATFERVSLLPYANWDVRPRDNDTQDEYTLITPEQLQQAVFTEYDPAEYELIDALNRMERGDYAGAVRRVTTAFEAELERALRQELVKTKVPAEVEEALAATRMNFARRLLEYEELRGEALPEVYRSDLSATREIRHLIVHTGRRIELRERGSAQRSVDTGRWMFNWVQNNGERTKLRETRLAFRSLGRNLAPFAGYIDSSGAVMPAPGWIESE